jgi:hypothetical protein
MHARRKLGAPNFRGSCAVAQIEHPNRRLDSTRTIPLHACCCNEKGDVLIKGCFFCSEMITKEWSVAWMPIPLFNTVIITF